MNVNVLVLDGVFDTGLAIVLDALTTANELASTQAAGDPPFDISLVGLRPAVGSAQRLSVPVSASADCARPDLVIVPALGYKLAGEHRLRCLPASSLVAGKIRRRRRRVSSPPD